MKHNQRRKRMQSTTVALKRLRCPACRSTDCLTTRTLDSGPSIITQRKRCKTCGKKFVVIFD